MKGTPSAAIYFILSTYFSDGLQLKDSNRVKTFAKKNKVKPTTFMLLKIFVEVETFFTKTNVPINELH